jgi:ribosomal protein L37AE/L43A
MVFCRTCQTKVEDCAHFVPPLTVRAVEVFDPKVKSLAYDERRHFLEIAYKNGQSWQLEGVSKEIYQELLHQTLSSFLKFIAHRYKASPVRKTSPKESIPSTEPCPVCKNPMTERHKTAKEPPARVLWNCDTCKHSFWRSYGVESVRERRSRSQ